MPKFVDRVVVHATAGAGGNGCASVHREKFKPLGGPDGGNGGRGGSVVLVVDPGVHTLLDFHHRPHAAARNGKQGQGGFKAGANADDLELAVPDGTVVMTPEGEILADLVGPGTRFVAAEGGRGGPGQRRARLGRPQGARLRAARRARRDPRPRAGAALDRRRRPRRIPVRRQVVAGRGAVRGPPEDRRLPVHHARPAAGRGHRGGGGLHGRGRPRADPGRVARAAGWGSTSCGTSSGARCWCTWSTARRSSPAAIPSRTCRPSRTSSPGTPRRSGGALADRPRLIALNKMDVPDARELAEHRAHRAGGAVRPAGVRDLHRDPRRACGS